MIFKSEVVLMPYTKKQVEKIVAKAVKSALAGSKSSKEDLVAKNRAKSIAWHEKKGRKVTEHLKVTLPTKTGKKEYDAVKFDNGKIGVFLASGYLKYAWADIK